MHHVPRWLISEWNVSTASHQPLSLDGPGGCQKLCARRPVLQVYPHCGPVRGWARHGAQNVREHVWVLHGHEALTVAPYPTTERRCRRLFSGHTRNTDDTGRPRARRQVRAILAVSNEASTCPGATSTSRSSSGTGQQVLQHHMARCKWQATCVPQTSRRAGTTILRSPSHADVPAYACLGLHKKLCAW